MNVLNGPVTTKLRKKINELIAFVNTYLPNGTLLVDAISEKTPGAGVNVNTGTSKIVTKTAEILVSAAELIAMYTTPKTLIAAPGAGFALSFIRAVIVYDSTATAFTSGGALSIGYTGGAACSSTLAATFLTGAGDKVWNMEKLNAANGFTMPVNTALSLTNASGVFATGTGVCRVQIEYSIHETSL